MKVEVKSFQTKVKGSKLDQRFQSYRHVKIGNIIHVYQLCLRLTMPPAIGRSACMEISGQLLHKRFTNVCSLEISTDMAQSIL